ncbi:MAG: acetyl-CoA carboxylase biotin carboxyl carrier protein subunit [Pirellulales bacterium]
MKQLRITVGKKTYDVTVEVISDDDPVRSRPVPARTAATAAALSAPAGAPPAPQSTGPIADGAVMSPMAGTVKSIRVKAGDTVSVNEVLLTLDAMKMEVPVSAPVAGQVASVEVKEGQSVQEGQALLVLN